MPRTKRVLSVVCAMVRLCGGLWPSVLVEYDFVVNFARGHGRSMSVQCFPMRPRSLPLHWTIFYPLRCHLTRRMALGFCRSDRPGGSGSGAEQSLVRWAFVVFLSCFSVGIDQKAPQPNQAMEPTQHFV